jgi:hypothetical protein
MSGTAGEFHHRSQGPNTFWARALPPAAEAETEVRDAVVKENLRVRAVFGENVRLLRDSEGTPREL